MADANIASIEAKYTVDTSSAVGSLAQVEGQLNQVAAATSRVDTSVRRTGQQAAAASRGVLEFSRAFEDFKTGGFIGVLNNVPGVMQSIGSAAGLAGPHVAILTTGASLLGTGGYIVWKNWESWTSVLREGHTETEAQRMERLQESTRRTAEETAELNRLKREQAEIEKLMAIKPDADKERAQALQKTVANEGGPGKITDAVAQSMYDETTGPEVEKQRDRLNRIADINRKHALGTATPDEQLERNRLEDESRAAAPKVKVKVDDYRKQAQKLINDAIFRGSLESFQKIQGMMKAAPERFGPGMLHGFKMASPEQQSLEEEGKQQARNLAAQANIRKEQKQREEKQAREDARIEKEIDAENDRKVREHERAVADQARQFEPAFKATAAQRMQADRAGNNPQESTDADLRKQVEASLASNTAVPEGLRAEVARKIVEGLRRDFAAAVLKDANAGAGDADAVRRMEGLPKPKEPKAAGGRRGGGHAGAGGVDIGAAGGVPEGPMAVAGQPPAPRPDQWPKGFRMAHRMAPAPILRPEPESDPAANARRDEAVAKAREFADKQAERNAAIRAGMGPGGADDGATRQSDAIARAREFDQQHRDRARQLREATLDRADGAAPSHAMRGLMAGGQAGGGDLRGGVAAAIREGAADALRDSKGMEAGAGGRDESKALDAIAKASEDTAKSNAEIVKAVKDWPTRIVPVFAGRR